MPLYNTYTRVPSTGAGWRQYIVVLADDVRKACEMLTPKGDTMWDSHGRADGSMENPFSFVNTQIYATLNEEGNALIAKCEKTPLILISCHYGSRWHYHPANHVGSCLDKSMRYNGLEEARNANPNVPIIEMINEQAVLHV